MPWCSSLLIHLGEPTHFREMLPFSSLWKNNFKKSDFISSKFSAIFFLSHAIQIGYLLYITIFSWEENSSRCAAPASAVFSIKVTTVPSLFLLKLPQCHSFAIFFRVFRWEWTGQHLHKDAAAPVHEDHARDHVQAGGAVCSLRAAHGQAEESGEPQRMVTVTVGVSLNLSACEWGHGHWNTRAELKVQSWAIPSQQPCPENWQLFTGSQ